MQHCPGLYYLQKDSERHGNIRNSNSILRQPRRVHISYGKNKQGWHITVKEFLCCQMRMRFSSHRQSNEAAGLPWWLSGKESACQSRRHRFDPWSSEIPQISKWQPTPAFFPGEPREALQLPWNCKASDMT